MLSISSDIQVIKLYTAKIYNRKDWKGWIMYSSIYVFSLCMPGLGDNSLVIIQPHQSLYNERSSAESLSVKGVHK